MEEKLRKVRASFEQAAQDFDFTFTSPYELPGGLTAFAHIDHYGSEKGTVIFLVFPPDFEVQEGAVAKCKAEGFFSSYLNVELLLNGYSRAYFREMLRDWGRF